jgi:hypothetical protein
VDQVLVAKNPTAPRSNVAKANLQFDSLLIYSLFGGFLVQRYLPKVLIPLGAGVVGAISNVHSWNGIKGAPKKPIYVGAALSAFYTLFAPFSPIAGTIAGSSIYSLYYASKHRGQQLESEEFF